MTINTYIKKNMQFCKMTAQKVFILPDNDITRTTNNHFCKKSIGIIISFICYGY